MDPTIAGYDLVYLVTQETLNNQFALLLIDASTGDQSAVINPHLVIATNKTNPELPYRIDAMIGPPVVTIPPASQAGTKVQLTLTFASGTFLYWAIDDNGQASKASADMTGWQVGLEVDVSHLPIDPATYAAMPVTTRDALPTNLNVFSVQALLLDMTSATAIDAAYKLGSITGNVAAYSGFVNALNAWLAGFAPPNNPFILGYATSAAPDAPASATQPLSPTAVQFRLVNDAAVSPVVALSYLLMTDNAAVPTDPTAGILTEVPVDSDSQGAFMISSRKIFGPLMDNLVDALHDAGGNNLSVSANTAQCDYQGGTLSAAVSIDPNTPAKIDIAYKFHKYSKNEWDMPVTGIELGSASVDYTATWTDTILLSCTDGTSLAVSTTQGSKSETITKSDSGLDKAVDWLKDAVNTLISVANDVIKVINVSIPTLNIDLSPSVSFTVGTSVPAFSMVLPSGKALGFRKARFTGAGHLVLQTYYLD